MHVAITWKQSHGNQAKEAEAEEAEAGHAANHHQDEAIGMAQPREKCLEPGDQSTTHSMREQMSC